MVRVSLIDLLDKQIVEAMEEGLSLDYFIKSDAERTNWIMDQKLHKYVESKFREKDPFIPIKEEEIQIPTTAMSYIKVNNEKTTI